jgi:hypothetical protein
MGTLSGRTAILWFFFGVSGAHNKGKGREKEREKKRKRRKKEKEGEKDGLESLPVPISTAGVPLCPHMASNNYISDIEYIP